MKEKVNRIQENARIIDDIADHLVSDHIELMLENKSLRDENEKLLDIIMELMDEYHPRECWSDAHIEEEMTAGNMFAPVVKRAYDALRGKK